MGTWSARIPSFRNFILFSPSDNEAKDCRGKCRQSLTDSKKYYNWTKERIRTNSPQQFCRRINLITVKSQLLPELGQIIRRIPFLLTTAKEDSKASLYGEKYLKRLLWYLFAGTRGGPSRAEIIKALQNRPCNANQLAQVLHVDYKTIQHHVREGQVFLHFGSRSLWQFFRRTQSSHSGILAVSIPKREFRGHLRGSGVHLHASCKYRRGPCSSEPPPSDLEIGQNYSSRPFSKCKLKSLGNSLLTSSDRSLEFLEIRFAIDICCDISYCE